MIGPPAHAETTIRDALAAARAGGIDRLDAQILLLHALGHDQHDRAWLITHDDHALAPDAVAHFQSLCKQRRAGVPAAYLTGFREFYGLALRVDARVLDPRPDTETLIDWALELIPRDAPWRVVDLGTGSGAIALALARQRPAADVWATDSSADALAVARANADRLRIPIRFARGDWCDALDQERFDLIVSNPPYIAENDPHMPALANEPRTALVSGPDGLRDLSVLCHQAPAHLKPGGWLLLEHGWDQAEAVRALLRASGFQDVRSKRDLASVERCSGGRMPAPERPSESAAN